MLKINSDTMGDKSELNAANPLGKDWVGQHSMTGGNMHDRKWWEELKSQMLQICCMHALSKKL